MSYDITIRGDNQYSQHVNAEMVRDFIVSLEGVGQSDSQRQLLYKESSEFWMNIDLESVTADGDLIEDDAADDAADDAKAQVNCIRMHIPYDYWDEDKAPRYFSLCARIADYLGWTAFDQQTGNSFSSDYSPY